MRGKNWEKIRNINVFPMVKPVPLFRRTDFKLLLCNHKGLFFLRVSKLLGCFSPKSMWFLWNIFSKGTHMLQCLCGKSLKKNKNPTGKQSMHHILFFLLIPCLLLTELGLHFCYAGQGTCKEPGQCCIQKCCMNKQVATAGSTSSRPENPDQQLLAVTRSITRREEETFLRSPH